MATLSAHGVSLAYGPACHQVLAVLNPGWNQAFHVLWVTSAMVHQSSLGLSEPGSRTQPTDVYSAFLRAQGP